MGEDFRRKIVGFMGSIVSLLDPNVEFLWSIVFICSKEV